MFNLQKIQGKITDPSTLAFLSWIGLAVGVLGLLLSYYFFLKSVRAKRPYCLTFTHSISRSVLMDVPDLRITYKGSPVGKLSLTKLVFWNAGRETINSTDVPLMSPFAVSVDGDGRILSCKLDFVKKTGNGVSLSVRECKKSVSVDFDYFDKNDGFVVELLHTGESDSAIKIEGTFKGAHGLVHRSAAPFLSLPTPIRTLLASEQRALAGSVLVITPILVFLDIYFRFLPEWFSTLPELKSVSDYIAIFITFGGFFAAGVYLLRTRLPAGFAIKW